MRVVRRNLLRGLGTRATFVFLLFCFVVNVFVVDVPVVGKVVVILIDCDLDVFEAKGGHE